MAVIWAGVVGCHRGHYRSQADREVYCTVATATSDPRWDLEDFSIQPHPASRMYDPDNPDCPPMPPDDPESHQLMHCVDGKQGWKHWHRYGNTPFVENPIWRAYLPRNAQGEVILDRQGAMQLALLHSRDYQRELEELYLSALAVTFERFRFDTQFFGGTATSYTADGPLRSGNSQSVLRHDNTLQAQRLFATGAELLVGLANSFVWQFSGPDGYQTNTLLNFSLMQPLLRAGGRAVVLERLTDSERALLANIRQMEQFRRGFYTEIIAGRNPGPGPSRAGIGIPSTSFPSASAGGFLGLLADQIRIFNQQVNVELVQESVEKLRALTEREEKRKPGGEPDAMRTLQIAQTEQGLYEAQSRLLALEADYQDRLDSFKLLLGLPPDLEVRVADPALEHLYLIAPATWETRRAVKALQTELRQADKTVRPEFYAELADLEPQVANTLQGVERDLEALIAALPMRYKGLEVLRGRKQVQSIDPLLFEPRELDMRVVKLLGMERAAAVLGAERIERLLDYMIQKEHPLEALPEEEPAPPPAAKSPGDVSARRARLREALQQGDYARTKQRIEEVVGRLQRLAATRRAAPAEAELSDKQREVFINELGTLADLMLELTSVQARARVDAVPLIWVELEPEEAFRIARENRPDWMNARAALVDTWRQIEVTANALRSDLNLTFSGDINTVDNNPVNFRGSTGRLRVGVEFDAPLTRLAERNAYRTAQIAYQQARREYYAFEDRIHQILRSTLRDIREVGQPDFESRRASLFVATTQLDLTLLRLQHAADVGPTTARDLLQAMSALLSAQNNFLTGWLNYEIQRMNLDFDMGTMQLDQNSMWLDPGPIEAGYGRAEGAEPIEPVETPQPAPLPAPQPGLL